MQFETQLPKKKMVFRRHVVTHAGFLKHPPFYAPMRLRQFARTVIES